MAVQSNFDERDSLKREKAYKREDFCASDSFYRQNFAALFSRIILSAKAIRVLTSRF
jgi:hypothetical protein